MTTRTEIKVGLLLFYLKITQKKSNIPIQFFFTLFIIYYTIVELAFFTFQYVILLYQHSYTTIIL